MRDLGRSLGIAPHAPVLVAVLATLALSYRGARLEGSPPVAAFWSASLTMMGMLVIAGIIAVIAINTISFGD